MEAKIYIAPTSVFFESALEQSSYSPLEIAGLVQSFEFTFELAWKTIKDFLYEQGIEVNSPREAIKSAFNKKIIADGHLWIEILEKRNILTHTYDSKVAENAIETIKFRYYYAIAQVYKFLKDEFDKNE